MPGTSPQGTGLRRSLSVWQAIGLSIALMAPSMAANVDSQASAATAGRAVPLAFLIAAVGGVLVAYTFVRLCQYYHHSGSVYTFVGATLGPRPVSWRAGACSAPTRSTRWSRPRPRASSAPRS